MGMGAGADAIRMEAACIAVPSHAVASSCTACSSTATGQRFITEDPYRSLLGEIGLFRQDGRVWLVVDDAVYETPRCPPRATRSRTQSRSSRRRRRAFPKGTSWLTLDRYNAGAARGEDPLFRKVPRWLAPLVSSPYAARLSLEKYPFWSAFTLGGLHTRPTGEVIDPDGEIVHGLYAAGRTPRGCPRTATAAGSRSPDATFSGRLAGVAAAKHGGLMRADRRCIAVRLPYDRRPCEDRPPSMS